MTAAAYYLARRRERGRIRRLLRQESQRLIRLVDSPSSQKHTSPVAGSEIDDSPFRLVLKVHRLPDYFRVKVPVAGEFLCCVVRFFLLHMRFSCLKQLGTLKVSFQHFFVNFIIS